MDRRTRTRAGKGFRDCWISDQRGGYQAKFSEIGTGESARNPKSQATRAATHRGREGRWVCLVLIDEKEEPQEIKRWEGKATGTEGNQKAEGPL